MSGLFVKLPDAAVRIIGWTAVRVERSLDALTGSFTLEMTERFPDEVSEATLIAGAPIEVWADDENRLITGYVDSIEYIYAPDDHLIRVRGRGKCQDLIDCSAALDRIYPNTRLDAICRGLAAPFGIDVNMSTSLQTTIDSFPAIPFQLISITETCLAVIEQCCRYSGILAFEQEDGSLELAVAGDDKSSSGLATGSNIESAVSVKSSLGRFSTVSAVLSNYNNAQDIGVNLMPVYSGTDPGVKRTRPLFIVSEQPASDRTYLERRVLWQIARSYGQSRQVRILVDSWYDSQGLPWRLNYQISVSLPELKIPANTMLLVAGLAFILDESGTHTEITLTPRQAYLPEPLVIQAIDPDIAP